MTHVINILFDNCFPLPFIFATIKTRIKTLINRTVNEANDNHHRSQLNQKVYFTIPYIKSESFILITKKFSYDIAYSIPNTMNKIIKRGKDKIEHMSINDCVYKINCLNCEKSYVGQTKRQLGTRVKEHKSDITKKNGLLSVISEHRLEKNHNMNWTETTILDIESSYVKRMISEMIYIKRQDKGLNKNSDTALLPEVYYPIIDILPLL